MATITNDTLVFSSPPAPNFEENPPLGSVVESLEGWWEPHREAVEQQTVTTILVLCGKVNTLAVELTQLSLQDGMQERRGSLIEEYNFLKSNAETIASFSEVIIRASSYAETLVAQDKFTAPELERNQSAIVDVSSTDIELADTQVKYTTESLQDLQGRIATLMKSVSLANGLYHVNMELVRDRLETLCYRLDHGRMPLPGAVLTIAPYDPNKIETHDDSHVVESSGWRCCGLSYKKANQDDK